jgi:hypothetical protein
MVRTVAILTVLAFGCTTVRVPALPAGDVEDAPGTVAQPSIELWLESPDPVPQAQSDMAADAAREAISRALSEVRISSSALGATDAVLFVRERGVALTDARHTQQTWAKVGIVVGVVFIVAAIIIGVTKTTGSHGGSHNVVRTPAAVGGTVVHRAPRPVAPIPYVPHYYAPAPSIFIGFNFVIPIHPMVYQPQSPESEDELPFPPDAPAPMLSVPAPPPEADGLPHPPEAYASNGPPAPPDAGPPIELPPLSPPADFGVEDRGFFDGPHVALQLDLVDRATGEVLWSRPVASDGNPCDANDVRQLVHAALVNESWATGPAFSRR